MNKSTIYALSSGGLPSGVAIIRMSGPGVRFAFETMVGFVPEPRILVLSDIFDQGKTKLLDRGIAIYFEGPRSFTGEDCGEFQIHGGLAVVDSVLNTLGKFEDFKAAEAGEFSKRSFENGKLDLTELEGLSDLLASQTEMQRIQAISQSKGQLRKLYENWCDRLVKMRALVEAGLDFSDQDDVSNISSFTMLSDITVICREICEHLNDDNRGEIIRGGFKIALMGSTNSGKSSLLNALARREVAIVSKIAGTTRDVIEVDLDISGFKVIVSDTAGIRKSKDVIEVIGMRKAVEKAHDADLIVWLSPSDCFDEKLPSVLNGIPNNKILIVRSKSDLSAMDTAGIRPSVSVVESIGLNSLLDELGARLNSLVSGQSDLVLSRRRHRELLDIIMIGLQEIVDGTIIDEELVCESLRRAVDGFGKIVGRVDVEQLYDHIFSEFCIGK